MLVRKGEIPSFLIEGKMGIIILLVAMGSMVVLIGVLGCVKALIAAKKYFLSWINDD